MAPFSGNNMLALYHCPGNNSSGILLSGAYKSKYFVQVLHNEIPTPLMVRLAKKMLHSFPVLIILYYNIALFIVERKDSGPSRTSREIPRRGIISCV